MTNSSAIRSNSCPIQPVHGAVVTLAEEVHDKAEKVHGGVEYFNRAIKTVEGQFAFRRYKWLAGVPDLNTAGNLRGMVIDAKVRTAFNFSVKVADAAEMAGDVLLVAGMAIETVKSRRHLEALYHSNMSTSDKIPRLILAADMIVWRALTAPVVPATHLLAHTIEKAMHFFGSSQHSIEAVRKFDADVKSTYTKITDDEEIVHFIDTRVQMAMR